MSNDKELSLWEHLEELRTRLIRIIIAVIVTGIIGYIFSDQIIYLLSKPVGKLYFFSPPEAFLIRLKILLFSGLFFSAPYMLYELWKFVEPGLLPHEKRYSVPLIVSGTVLFYIGIAFGLFVALPLGVKVLLEFGGKYMQGLFNAKSYFNFALLLLFSFGILFEFPVVIVFLSEIGVIDPYKLSKQRKYVIVGIFVVAAIITPSVDMVTQSILAIPLILLFEISIFFSKLARRRRKEAKTEEKKKDEVTENK